MKSVIAVIAALAATIVSAQSNNIASVTYPLSGTVYTAGQNALITWINPTVGVISQIVLAKGNPSALQQVATIAQNVDANAGSYSWTIPSDTTAGDDYVFILGTTPNLAYSGSFTIQNGISDTAATPSVPP